MERLLVSISSPNVLNLRALTLQPYSGGQHNITLSRRTFFRIILKWNRVTLQQPGGSVVTFSRPEQTFNIHTILEIISCQGDREYSEEIYSAIGNVSTGK